MDVKCREVRGYLASVHGPRPLKDSLVAVALWLCCVYLHFLPPTENGLTGGNVKVGSDTR